MVNKTSYFNLKKIIIERIKANGGWVNCHAHIDRAYTLTKDNFRYSSVPYQEKWAIVDELKQQSSVTDIYDHMAQAIETLLAQGVTALGTFIDVDEYIKDRAIQAAIKIREKYKKDISLKYINHVKKGVLEHQARKWFKIGTEFADIVGSMLGTDKGKDSEHLDVVIDTAKRLNKMVHVHVDQSNMAAEKETELLVDKTVKYGMQGKVVAIHSISLGTHPKNYRQIVYQKMKQAGVMVVSSPSAHIDSARSEEMVPKHNSITPVDELVPEGIVVGLGTDNFADITVPFTNGDMWEELKLLMIACRMRNLDTAVDIATINGRRILGL